MHVKSILLETFPIKSPSKPAPPLNNKENAEITIICAINT